MAKYRMIELGYCEAGGVRNYVNDTVIPDHGCTWLWPANTTFTISAKDAALLATSDSEFERVICSGRYRYVEGHFCRNTNKYIVLVDDLRERLNEKMDERQQLSQEEQLLSEMKHNYDFFIRCVEALPEINKAGMKLNVNGLDTDGSCLRDFGGKARSKILSDIRRGKRKMGADRVDQAPHFLEFEKGIYFAFIKEGIVDGDVVTYTTNFGVELTSTGNSRTLMAFIGFRRCNPNKTVEVLMDGWQVNGLCIRYHREKKKEKTAHTLMIRKRKAQERALLEQEA